MKTITKTLSTPLSLFVAGTIPEECSDMRNLIVFKVKSNDDLASESASSTSCTHTLGICLYLQRVPTVKQ